MSFRKHIKFFISRMREKVKAEDFGWMFLFFTGGYLVIIGYLYYTPPHSDGAYIAVNLIYVSVLFFLCADTIFKRASNTGYRMSPITSLGFTLEQRGGYTGYKGIYKGYFMRVYNIPYGDFYRLSDDLCIIVYYKAPANQSADDVKERLTKKYLRWRKIVSVVILIPKMYIDNNSITRLSPFGSIWTFGYIKRKINYIVSIPAKEGLDAMTEAEVDEWIGTNPDNAPMGFKKVFDK